MIGFVYILVNEYMPDLYKVGCTERAPHARAEELSKPSGVPAPFDVLCYIEVENFQAVEQRLHAWLRNYRVSNNREFFEGGLHHAVSWMYWLEGRHAFCAVPDHSEPDGEAILYREEFDELFTGHPCREFQFLPNPWEQPEASEVAPEPAEAKPPFDGIDELPWEKTPREPDLKVVGGAAL